MTPKTLYEAAKKALEGNVLYDAARRIRVERRQARQAEERRHYQAWWDSKSYQEKMVIRADALQPIRGARVLVVGANKGEDCRQFVERGAAEVHGLDVIADIGSAFAHPIVSYHRAGIEASGLESDYFDLVFSVATMEHVPDIKNGFAEMARLAKPGGTIFSHASPLWQSPHGHHMDCFEGHPWVHLVHGEAPALIAYAGSHGIAGERGHDIEGIVGYMLNPEFFNRRPGHEYVEACAALSGIDIRQNELVLEDERLLEHELGRRALALGYTRNDLLAVTHQFAAVRNGSA